MSKIMLKRVLLNNFFWLGTSLLLLTAIGQFLLELTSEKNAGFFLDTNHAPYFFDILHGGWASLISQDILYYYELLFPIVVTLLVAGIYRQDKNSGYFSLIVSRNQHRPYFTSLFLVNALITFFAIFLMLALNFYLFSMTYPSANPTLFSSYGQGGADGLTSFASLFYSHPTLYMFIVFCMNAIYAVVLTTIALAASIYVNRIYIVYLIPFLVNLAWMSLDMETLSPIDNYTHRSSILNAPGFLLVLGLLFIAATTAYVIGSKKYVYD